MGNVDLAVEFLMNGIPDEAALTGANLDGDGDRAPQFDDLRRTIQANPGALQQVLAGIGRDSPELLALIRANQAEFLQMMNEPVARPRASGDASGRRRRDAQFARAMAAITPAQRAQLAATIGLTPDQFEHFAEQMQNMPRDQLRQLLGAISGGGGMGGGGRGPPGGGGGAGNVVRLTREEADAVGRLQELGFSR
ncbi:nucleotide excision repair protein [Aureococcus anophagefferens]|uniref:Nucleotide excision repair protein n=1 Tax=Aureococcus anophagefferens TaxID=44056 RepID=A0ABR1FI84_AURAN